MPQLPSVLIVSFYCEKCHKPHLGVEALLVVNASKDYPTFVECQTCHTSYKVSPVQVAKYS